MTLVKTKTRIPSHQRKVSGLHHRKNNKYLKTYWPYIPIALVLGGAAVASIYLPSSLNGSSTDKVYSARVDSLIGSNSAPLLDLMYLVLACLVIWYVIRHFKRIKSLTIDGEKYLVQHYLMDMFVGLLIGSLFILVR